MTRMEGAKLKTLIVYKSLHRKNTEKIARAMAEATGARIARVEEVQPEELAEYDLIGLGSGIYNDNFARCIFNLIEEIPESKLVFLFWTAAVLREAHPKIVREKLLEKGCRIVGEFACPGEFVPLGLNLGRELPSVLVVLSGKNKGQPDEGNLEKARTFVRDMVDRR